MYTIVKRDLQLYVKGENGDRVKYTFDIVKDGQVVVAAVYEGRAKELIGIDRNTIHIVAIE